MGIVSDMFCATAWELVCEVTYFPLVTLQVKKSHSESHVPDPSDVRYAHTFTLRKKRKKT